MTTQKAYERGVKIHEQMEEHLKKSPVEVYIEEETKLYERFLEYSQPDYILNEKCKYFWY